MVHLTNRNRILKPVNDIAAAAIAARKDKSEHRPYEINSKRAIVRELVGTDSTST